MIFKECFSVPRVKRLIVSFHHHPGRRLWVSQIAAVGVADDADVVEA